jgi:carbon storage regulator
MLVLSRKQGEKLHIGDNITITVLEVHGHVMKLGIEAPRQVRVLRGELQCWNEPEQAETLHDCATPAMAV